MLISAEYTHLASIKTY